MMCGFVGSEDIKLFVKKYRNPVRNTTINIFTDCWKKKHNDIINVASKIEKVPRSIRGEKSRKDAASSVKLVSTIGA